MDIHDSNRSCLFDSKHLKQVTSTTPHSVSEVLEGSSFLDCQSPSSFGASDTVPLLCLHRKVETWISFEAGNLRPWFSPDHKVWGDQVVPLLRLQLILHLAFSSRN